MPRELFCPCGASYRIRDEFAGQEVRCDQCHAVLEVPHGLGPEIVGHWFEVKEQILDWTEAYTVRDRDGSFVLEAVRPRRVLLRSVLRILIALAGMAFSLVLLAAVFGLILRDPGILRGRQDLLVAGYAVLIVLSSLFGLVISSLLRVKRHLGFFAEDGELLFWIHQATRIQFPQATYLLVGPDDRVWLAFKRNFFACLIKRTWRCEDMQGRCVWKAEEDSALRSLIRRRFARGLLSNLARTRLWLKDPETGQRVGSFQRRQGVWDQYEVDLSPDAGCAMDQRIALALCVLFSSVEGR